MPAAVSHDMLLALRRPARGTTAEGLRWGAPAHDGQRANDVFENMLSISLDALTCTVLINALSFFVDQSVVRNG